QRTVLQGNPFRVVSVVMRPSLTRSRTPWVATHNAPSRSRRRSVTAPELRPLADVYEARTWPSLKYNTPPPRQYPSHSPPCSRSEIRTEALSERPSSDQGICSTKRPSRMCKRFEVSESHRLPALSPAMECTFVPCTPLTETNLPFSR